MKRERNKVRWLERREKVERDGLDDDCHRRVLVLGRKSRPIQIACSRVGRLLNWDNGIS